MKRQRWCSDIDDGGDDRRGGGTAAFVVVRQQLAGRGSAEFGGGVSDKLAAAAVLAVGLEGCNWHVRLQPYLSLCKK